MKIKLICKYCNESFFREKGEVNRNKKAGRKTFCGRACARAYENKTNPNHNTDHLDSSNRRDEYTPYRWYMKVINNKNRSKKTKNLDLEYLKNLYESQKGICPLTGWKLVLPNSTKGFKGKMDIKRASLDRIDNSIGYVRGNVRFVSVMANWARNECNDFQLFKFCMAVVNNST